MKYDAKEFKRYPEIMSKEQMRIACHISKRSADMLFDQPFLDSCREPFERYIGYHLDSEFYEL